MALTTEEKQRIIEEEKLKKAMRGKSLIVAIILSVILPGLGDAYCGSWFKACVFFIMDFICFALAFVGLGVILGAIVWVCGIISAAMSAGKSEKKSIIKAEKSLV
ncbi:hypothetical protein DESC_90004 [Desulfosarcina cetonica]|uniref:hypothetical protein n=1 Tax=Desulfosarcina cetonica TaxID=90730 RepID=UPI0006D0C8CE|nr:hypothetical protein [Desulfosarcina cetonica]VTR71134.1 hypothetical protein DESC_90004 [Desulfosarcina cetonica]